MKLAVPLTAQGEAAILNKAGATEFYCGVQTLEWQHLYGNHDSISRRQGAANLSSLNELHVMLAETAELNAPLFLTVNGNYTEEQLPMVLSYVDAFEEMGGTGIMVADIALLSLLKKRNNRLIRGLSLLAAVSNCSAMAFYHELGVSRVVFPRFLRPDQISAITHQFPDIETECIVWIDKCRFIDGYCRFLHPVGYERYPGSDNACIPERVINTYDTSYCSPACFELLGYPPRNPACAACSLAALKKAGVSVFKIGGRGRPLDIRLSGIQFLRQAENLTGSDEIKKLYVSYFGSPCCNDICYYGWGDNNG